MRTKPDIQLQLKYHMLACEAALRWKALTDAGELTKARKAALEAVKWEKEWRRYGGKGKLI